jgi:phospholipid transport system substrate-binding protein
MKLKLKLILGLSLLNLNYLNAIEESKITPEISNMQNVLAEIALSKDTILQNYQRMDNLVTPLFDFRLMGKLILGKKYWKRATVEQKEEYLIVFTKTIKDFYLKKFGLYNGQKLELKAPIKKKNRIYLTNLIIEDNVKNEITYKLYRSKNDGWLIYDVDIVGVSVIKLFRAQYKNILQKTNSIDELINQIK